MSKTQMPAKSSSQDHKLPDIDVEIRDEDKTVVERFKARDEYNRLQPDEQAKVLKAIGWLTILAMLGSFSVSFGCLTKVHKHYLLMKRMQKAEASAASWEQVSLVLAGKVPHLEPSRLGRILRNARGYREMETLARPWKEMIGDIDVQVRQVNRDSINHPPYDSQRRSFSTHSGKMSSRILPLANGFKRPIISRTDRNNGSTRHLS